MGLIASVLRRCCGDDDLESPLRRSFYDGSATLPNQRSHTLKREEGYQRNATNLFSPTLDPQPHSFRSPSGGKVSVPSASITGPSDSIRSKIPRNLGEKIENGERTKTSFSDPQPHSFRSPSGGKVPVPSASVTDPSDSIRSKIPRNLGEKIEKGERTKTSFYPQKYVAPSASASITRPSDSIRSKIPRKLEEKTDRTLTTPSTVKKGPSGAAAPSGPLGSTSFDLLPNKGGTPVYKTPRCLEEQIEKGEVPSILKDMPCPTSYSDYFACLLHAEDCYLEKWSEYLLLGVTLQMSKREDVRNKNTLDKRQDGNTRRMWEEKKRENDKDYVTFELDAIRERRPFLLSRDFVFLQPANQKSENPKKFEGSLVRVRGSTVFTEFNDDFHSKHKPESKYNVSFSFNRVCLKRAHHAVANALGPVLFNFLFPPRERIGHHICVYPKYPNLDSDQSHALHQIINLKSPAPYLIKGPLSTGCGTEPSSKVGSLIREAVVKLYRASNQNRILICTPKNATCDLFMSSLSVAIPEQDMFRANAAFRGRHEVPTDILASSTYDENKECFVCPPLQTLKGFRLVTSTYMSTFRLSNAGVGTEHFTHIFLVDASSVTEPEAAVPLATLASESTVVVVSGSLSDLPCYIRSDLSRVYGLKLSLFRRLLQREPYLSGDPSFVLEIKGW